MEDGSGIMAAYIKICIYEYKHYNIYIFRKKKQVYPGTHIGGMLLKPN
jgi:hypothetical protein